MDAALRATPSKVAAATLPAAGALLIWALFAGGGSGTGSTATLGSAAVVVAALLEVGWGRGVVGFPRLDRPGRIAAIAAVSLVAWTGLTVWWSIAGDRSWDALSKGIVLLAFGVVGFAVAATPGRPLRNLALVLAAGLAAVLGWALIGKVVPALGPDDAGRAARLHGVVGIWNALALLADTALGLGLWLTTAFGAGRSRYAGALLLYLATLVILLTQSRAGLLAGLAVVAFGLALSAGRLGLSLYALISCGPGLLVAAWAFTRPALVEDGGERAARASNGAALGMLAVIGAVVVIAAVWGVPVARLVSTRPRAVARTLLAAVAVIAVAGVLGLVASVGNPVSWVSGQLTTTGEVQNGPGRLGQLESNNRTVWWGEAWRIFKANPVGGTGASTFEIARKRVRADAERVVEPHSVPLQLLAETGLPGFLLGLVLVGGVIGGIRSALARLGPDERAAAVGLASLPLAFGLHSLVDIDLDFLAVAAPTALVVAALLGAGRPALAAIGGPRSLAAVLVACAALGVLIAPALSARAVDAANSQSAGTNLAAAAASARRAQRLNPLSIDALYARATIAGLARDQDAAESFYLQATRLQPENPDTWYQLGLFRFLTGDLCGAYYAFNNAYTLDPKSTLFYRGGEFDQAKAAVNDRDHPACG